MNIDKMKRLEAHGWKVGSAEEFLGLSSEEIIEVNKRLDMSKLLRWTRKLDESLFLEVLEGDKWVNYKNAKFYVSDAKMSSNSGFATAQKYLSLGYRYVSTLED